MIIAERFLSKVVEEYGLNSASSTDGDIWYPRQACRFLKLVHMITHYKKKYR